MEYLSKIVKDLIRELDPIDHLISSYNDFINIWLPSILDEKIVYKGGSSTIAIETSNLFIGKPNVDETNGTIQNVLPETCLFRNIDYVVRVIADVDVYEYDQCLTPDFEEDDMEIDTPIVEAKLKNHWSFKSIELFQVPCMIGCKLCLNPTSEMRGLFLLNGEKCIVSQERMRQNSPMIYPCGNGRFDWCLEYRSAHAKIRSSSTVYLYSRLWELHIHVPFLLGTCQMKIPLIALLKLYDHEDPDAFIQTVCSFGADEKMYHIVKRMMYDDKYSQMSVDEVKTYLRSKCIPKETNTIKQTLENEFLPHTDSKLDVIAYCVWSIVRVQCYNIVPEDRDSHISKRVECPGMTLAILLRQLYRAQVKEVCKLINRYIQTDKPLHPTNIFNLKRVYNGIVHAIKTGNFSVRQASVSMQGISQALSNFNSLSKLAHLRRISTPRTHLSYIIYECNC